MEKSTSRPRPGDPPSLNSDLETLEFLLSVEKKRLEVALRIEGERSIEFPETTVIIHDILKLQDAIRKHSDANIVTEKTDFCEDLLDGKKRRRSARRR